MPRVALCVISFLAACTIANTVSKKLPNRSRMCFVEWYFVYNFLLIASCVFLHAASHYIDVNISTKRSDAVDNTMRWCVPFIHLGSYFFAWVLSFTEDPYAEIFGATEFLLAIFATFVVWKMYENEAKNLEAKERSMEPALSTDIEKNALNKPALDKEDVSLSV